MKKPNLIRVSTVIPMLLGLGVCVALLAGCEVDSADQTTVKITPDYFELKRLESVQLTATGWDTYRWSLATPGIGTLSGTTGNTVTYTATDSGSEEEMTQVVYADGVIATATNGINLRGEARIVHLSNAPVDPELPVISIGDAGSYLEEDSDFAIFPVKLNKAHSATVTAEYTTVAGSATANADFASKTGNVIIPAGQTSAEIFITIINDTTPDEGNEVFYVTLSSPVNATLGQSQASAIIVDDD